MSFGSNVTPSRFGKRETLSEWQCICDTQNQRWRVQCGMCGLNRDVAREARETPDKFLEEVFPGV